MTQIKYTTDGTNGSYYTETRSYNNLLQLTRLTVPGVAFSFSILLSMALGFWR